MTEFIVNFWEHFCYPCSLYLTTSIQQHQLSELTIFLSTNQTDTGIMFYTIHSFICQIHKYLVLFHVQVTWSREAYFCIEVGHTVLELERLKFQILAQSLFSGHL